MLNSANAVTTKKPLVERGNMFVWILTWTSKRDEEPRPKPSSLLGEPDRPRGEGSPSHCCSGCSQTSPWSAPLHPPESSRSTSELRARLRSVGRIGWIQRPLTGLEHNRHLYSRLEQKGQGLAGLLGPAPVWGSFYSNSKNVRETWDLGLFLRLRLVLTIWGLAPGRGLGYV